MTGLVVDSEDCAESKPGRPPCTAGELILGTNTVDPASQHMGTHCDHWYEDEGCCYCETDSVNLLIVEG